MAIENSVSKDFLSMFFDCINIFDCCLPGVFKKYQNFMNKLLFNLINSISKLWLTCRMDLRMTFHLEKSHVTHWVN